MLLLFIIIVSLLINQIDLSSNN